MKNTTNEASIKRSCLDGSPLRYKTAFGGEMRARKIENQQTEVLIKTKVLNIYRDVGMSVPYRVV
jgi:hypothetical protein